MSEYEKLDSKWIDKNKFEVNGWNEAVHVEDLQNLIVPKKELPVIPKYVADFIESRKHTYANTFQYILQIAMGNSESPRFNKEYDWIRQSVEVFARAWLDGYEIEKEKLYYIVDKNDEVLWFRNRQGVPRLSGSTLRSVLKSESKQRYQFTEQEIKNYDERFWPFAEPVEQADFRLSF